MVVTDRGWPSYAPGRDDPVAAVSPRRHDDLPSDAARVVGGEDWREHMSLAREVAAALHDEGVVEVQQKGEMVPDPRQARGPIRIARTRLSQT